MTTTFQSKIYLKTSQTPITVSRDIASKVDKTFQDPYVDEEQIISVGDMSFRKNQIKGVMVFPDIRESTKFQEDADAAYRKEIAERKGLLAKPNRHEDVRFFEFICASLGVKPTPEMLTRAIEAQRVFFAENPKRVYADPHRFTKFLPKVGGLLQGAGIRLIEAAVRRDITLAK